MANDLSIIEREMDRVHMPTLANILTQTPGLPAVAFRSAFLESISKTPQLMECTRVSLFNCAASFSFLGLLPGSFAGQAYMLPFRDNKRGVTNAVPVIGYRGFNTIAKRSGVDIEGMCVRKDDDFKCRAGSDPRIDHYPNLEKSDAQIIGAWSQLHNDRTGRRYSHVVLGIKQLLQIKAKSKGSRKEDSPWNDDKGPGFEAMCEKSARRRQARSIPLNAFVMADAIETLHDLGKPAWIVPAERDGQMTIVTPEGQTRPPPPEEPTIIEPPKNFKLVAQTGPKKAVNCRDVNEWSRVMTQMIKATSAANIPLARKANAQMMHDLAMAGFEREVQAIVDIFSQKEGN